MYGLRLLNDPRVRLWIASLLALTLVGFRIVQVIATRQTLPWGYDFRFYWLAGGQLLHGQSIYSAAQLAGQYAPQGQEGFLYPPPLAALLVPVAALSPDDFLLPYAIWVALWAAIAGVAVLAVSRAEGLADRFSILRGRPWLLLAGVFALPPVIGELVNGNVDLPLLALLAVGWLGLRRGDERGDAIAGIAVGAATIVKVFPGLLIVWFVLSRRYRATAWSVVGILALALMTLPLTGIQPWLDYPTVLRNMAAPIDTTFSLAPTTWLSPALGFATARVAVTLLGLVIVAWVARRPDTRTGFATTVLVALLVTPVLWEHYLTVMVLPLILAPAAGVPIAMVGAVYVLVSAGNQAAFGDIGFFVARALPTAGMLLLLGALLIRLRPRRTGEVPA